MVAFQYPLVDRVGFEGLRALLRSRTPARFQYPLVDRVGFEGVLTGEVAALGAVSVSSGGSSWF